MSEKMDRRKFFSLNFESVIGFLGNAITPQLELDRDFSRPPGAAPSELDFLTTCNRCTLCKDACPENTIKLFSFGNGAKLVNTPYIDPNETACTFCRKCIEICPTNALSETEVTAIGYAKIDELSCLAFKNVMCDYCVHSCPVQDAIQLQNGKPVINRDTCNGCGLCVAGCITEMKGIRIIPSN